MTGLLADAIVSIDFEATGWTGGPTAPLPDRVIDLSEHRQDDYVHSNKLQLRRSTCPHPHHESSGDSESP